MKIDQPTNLGDIDPARIDVATDPKPKQSRRKVQKMPALLKPWAEKAKARMDKRPASPGVMMEPRGDLGDFQAVAPHDNHEVWSLQIHDAFGTRSPSTVAVFMDQLRSLCGQNWNDERKAWHPSETELNAALNFINSVQPRNEAEAALAAQMLAVHFMTMRMSSQALKTGDAGMASIAAKLARTYAAQMDTLQQARGKRRSTRQHITVRHEKHIHTHQHQHLAAWGYAVPEPAPSTLPGEHHGLAIEQRAEAVCSRPPVSGEDPVGQVVPIGRRARKAGV
ncbi:hypothetical protein [Sphingomonas sp. S-NIH.Pt15_0812]|uniref:hypothetical protein n=1 Tax=Sphingomonas sp. S-NIH.Pt15_0812 TaxID=1920129 RepID=UPI000F7D7C39|nr:hypothetical protein [Sphingomonas sp. S-NIH.Pt15_0812]